MAWMRGQVARVAAMWLALHVCLLVSVPTTLCSMGVAAAAGDCTCPHEGVIVCPMHHPKATAKSSSEQCSCKSTADPVAAMTSALLGPSAVLAPAASPVTPPEATTWRTAFAPAPIDSASVPDSPPPRA